MIDADVKLVTTSLVDRQRGRKERGRKRDREKAVRQTGFGYAVSIPGHAAQLAPLI